MIDDTLLIHRYFEGLLEGDEIRDFNERVRSQPGFRTLLARMAFDETVLHDLVESVERAQPAPRPGPRWGAIVPIAAAALVLVGIVALFFRAPPAAGYATVASGRLDVIPAIGVKLTVLEAALLRLPGGATAELASGTQAVLHEDRVELLLGGGSFAATRIAVPGILVGGKSFRAEFRGASLFVSGEVEINRDGLCSRLAGEHLLRREKRGAEHKGWWSYDKLLREASVTLVQALAAGAAKGTAIHAVLENEENRTIYAVELATGKTSLDLDIDAADGHLLDSDEEDGDRSALVAAIPLAQAVEAALRDFPGKAVEAKVEIVAEAPVITVTIVAGDRLVWVRLDGRAGTIVDRGLLED